MKNFINVLFIVFAITGCAQNTVQSDGEVQWDFDHKVHFVESKLSNSTFKIIIYAKTKVPFSHLSAFLMRYSLDVCQGYGFKVEVLSGVEGLLDRKVKPNYIQPYLVANLDCAVNND